MNKILKEWINKIVDSKSHIIMEGEHVDFFVKHKMVNDKESLSISVDIYLECVNYAISTGLDKDIMIRLSVPFYWQDGIVMFDGHYYFNTEEPPSIYLVSRAWHLRKRAGEFYRKTIASFDERLCSDNYHTYYRCGVYDSWDRNYDMDYMRYVYVDHYCDEYLLRS